MLRVAIALALSGVIAAPVLAQSIVKCTDARNRIEYRNSPCPPGTRGDTVEVSNLSIIETGRLPARAARTDERRADEVSRAARVPAQPSALPVPSAETGANGSGAGETVPSPRRY